MYQPAGAVVHRNGYLLFPLMASAAGPVYTQRLDAMPKGTHPLRPGYLSSVDRRANDAWEEPRKRHGLE